MEEQEKKETIKENEKMNPNQKEEAQKVQHEKDCKEKKFEKKEATVRLTGILNHILLSVY